MTKKQKEKIRKFIEVYKQYKQLEKEYDMLRKEILSFISEPVLIDNHIVAKQIQKRKILSLPKDVKGRLMKNYGKEIEVEVLRLRKV